MEGATPAGDAFVLGPERRDGRADVVGRARQGKRMDGGVRQKNGGSLSTNGTNGDRPRPLNGGLARRRLRELLEVLDAIVWEADPATFGFSYVSARAATLLGFPIEQWRSDPDFWMRLVHPDDREHTVELREAATHGEGGTLEYRVVAADGRVLWLREVIRVIVDRHGKIRSIRGTMVDITKAKAAEEPPTHLGDIADASGPRAAGSNGHTDAPAHVGGDRRTRFLAELGGSLALLGDPARLSARISELLGQTLGFKFALLARHGSGLELASSWPVDLARIEHGEECDLLKRLDRAEQLVTFSRAQLQCEHLPEDILTLALIPVRDQSGARTGVIGVGLSRAGGIRVDDQELLGGLAPDIGEALSLSASFSALAASATNDPLTGLLDERAFHARFAAELARAIRRGEQLAYLHWDLGGLDALNRDLGRDAGDQALRTFAEIVRTEVRQYDILGRVGGDEFAAVISGTNHEVAHRIAARIQQRAARTRIDRSHYLPFPHRGFALYPDDASDLAELVRIAEWRLYGHKRTRNGLVQQDQVKLG
jgi:diguanylate cyclase (GGDEF)-like protein/PAS domain S-box-containing protein